MPKSTAKDLPFKEAVDKALDMINRGCHVYQKFTCVNCGERQTIDTPNKFYKLGICEECKYQTDIEAQGCGFMLVTGM